MAISSLYLLHFDNHKVGALLVFFLMVNWEPKQGLRDVELCVRNAEHQHANNRKLGHQDKSVQRKRERERTKKEKASKLVITSYEPEADGGLRMRL